MIFLWKKPHKAGRRIAEVLVALNLLAAGIKAQADKQSIPPTATVSTWPAAGTLERGKTLLLTTDHFSREPYECKLQDLNDSGITCAGPHHRPVTYERGRVRTISIRTQHLRNAYIGFVVAGAALVGGGFACVFAGGGVPCAALLSAGLISSLVAGILHSVHELRKPSEPTPIYIAPEPAPIPTN